MTILESVALKNIFALEFLTQALKLVNVPQALDQTDILFLYLQPIVTIIESVIPEIRHAFTVFHFIFES